MRNSCQRSYRGIDAAIPATCTESGLTDGKHCSACDDVLVKQEEIPALKHNYVDGICNGCGRDEYSKGLQYALNDDEESYSVTVIGSCTDTDIIIPAYYNEKPVTGIGAQAFDRCVGLTSITIPDSVTSIGDRAFSDCTGLTSITIPNGVTSIGQGAFRGCTGLTSITIPFVGAEKNGAGNTHFGYIFAVWYDNESANYVPNSLKTVVITVGSDIDSFAFSGLTSITIPESVTYIGDFAFYDCTGLTSITFKGTKEQWTLISKGTLWDFNTGNYVIHCTDGDIEKSFRM